MATRKELVDLRKSIVDKLEKLKFEVKKEHSESSLIIKTLSKNFNDRGETFKNLKSAVSTKFKPILGNNLNIQESTKHNYAIEVNSKLPDKKVQLMVKPKNRQGILSAGKMIEENFKNKIESVLKENTTVPNIFFSDGNREFLCKNITSIKDVSKDVKDGKKADFELSGDETYRISIKGSNSEIWESSDSRFKNHKEAILKLINVAKDNGVEIEKIDTKSKISPEIAFKLSPSDKSKEILNRCIFGTDNVVVLKDNFSYNRDIVSKKVDGCEGLCAKMHINKIYKDIDEVISEDNIWFLVRNDRTRNSRILGPDFSGLRILAVTKSRVSSRVAKFSLNLENGNIEKYK